MSLISFTFVQANGVFVLCFYNNLIIHFKPPKFKAALNKNITLTQKRMVEMLKHVQKISHHLYDMAKTLQIRATCMTKKKLKNERLLVNFLLFERGGRNSFKNQIVISDRKCKQVFNYVYI